MTRPRRRLWGDDPVEASHLVISVLFTGCFGGVVGALANLIPQQGADESKLFLVVSGFVVGGVVPLVRSHFTSGWIWAGVRHLFEPSGGARSGQSGFSRAEAMVAQGRMIEAIAEYEALLVERPGEAEIHLRIARILRDEGKLEEAARRLRNARVGATLTPEADGALTRALVNLYQYGMDEPLRALPELARLAELYADTELGRWAQGERLHLKASVREDGALREDH